MDRGLVEELTRKGRDHGFDADSDGGAVTWSFREDEPVFSFLVDETDSRRVFTETLDLFWAS
ncbi:hypothetical protein JXL21_08240, partial [Candidatus Bathyarchaeota archaeon]|nr:hypothetical protein [Candidatus Bathyarchaeota archaeon]